MNNTAPLQVCQRRPSSGTSSLNHIAHLGRDRTNDRRRVSTDLLGEDTGIDDAQPVHAVHAAVEVDDVGGRVGSHAGAADGVVQRKGLLLHEDEKLLVGNLLRVGAGCGPEDVVGVVVGRRDLDKLLPVLAAGDLDGEAERCEHDLAVVVALVAEVLGVDDGCSGVLDFLHL